MKITKKQFEELPAWLKKSFTVNPDDADEFDNGETDEDVAGLKDALGKERKARKNAEKEAKELRGKVPADDDDDDDTPPAREPKAGSAAAKHKAALAAAQADADKRVAEAHAAAGKALVDAEIAKLAGEIFVKPGRDAVHLRDRVGYEVEDGKVVLVYKDAKGEVAAGLNAAGLKKEVLANKDFSGILLASRATGGGAEPKPSGSSEAGSEADKSAEKAPDYRKLSGKELVASLKAQGKAPAAEVTE